MRRSAVVVLSALLTMTVPGGVLAQDASAGAKSEEQARAYYRAGAFAQAAAEFARAYDLGGKATRLFNAALAYEKAGNKKRAAEFYGRYLEAESEGGKATEARARKAALDQEIVAAEKDASEARARAEREETAKQKASEARARQSAGRHGEAALLYEEAFLANGNVEFLFEMAEAQRLAGESDKAQASYRWYLQEATEGVSRDEARRRLDALSAATAATETAPIDDPEPDPDPEPIEEESAEPTKPPSNSKPDRHQFGFQLIHRANLFKCNVTSPGLMPPEDGDKSACKEDGDINTDTLGGFGLRYSYRHAASFATRAHVGVFAGLGNVVFRESEVRADGSSRSDTSTFGLAFGLGEEYRYALVGEGPEASVQAIAAFDLELRVLGGPAPTWLGFHGSGGVRAGIFEFMVSVGAFSDRKVNANYENGFTYQAEFYPLSYGTSLGLNWDF